MLLLPTLLLPSNFAAVDNFASVGNVVAVGIGAAVSIALFVDISAVGVLLLAVRFCCSCQRFFRCRHCFFRLLLLSTFSLLSTLTRRHFTIWAFLQRSTLLLLLADVGTTAAVGVGSVYSAAVSSSLLLSALLLLLSGLVLHTTLLLLSTLLLLTFRCYCQHCCCFRHGYCCRRSCCRQHGCCQIFAAAVGTVTAFDACADVNTAAAVDIAAVGAPQSMLLLLVELLLVSIVAPVDVAVNFAAERFAAVDVGCTCCQRCSAVGDAVDIDAAAEIDIDAAVDIAARCRRFAADSLMLSEILVLSTLLLSMVCSSWRCCRCQSWFLPALLLLLSLLS